MTTGFTIPNAPDAAYNDMAEPDGKDYEILQGDLYGVLSGCAVAQQASPNYTTAVAPGWVVVSGAVVQVFGQNVTHASPGANNRFDLVVVNGAGVASALTGSAADANARFPTIPDGYTVVASVYVPVGVANITTGLIVDKRVILDMAFKRALPATTTTAIAVRVQGDSLDRLSIRADGQMSWLGEAILTRIGTNLMRWTGGVTLTASSSSVVPLVAQGAGSQTANLFAVLDSSGNTLSYIDASGNAAFNNIKRGTGNPEGNVAGRVGDVYLRTDGAQDALLYVKEQYASNNPSAGWYPVRRVDPAANAGNMPIGGMTFYGGTVPPAGWLLCDGTLVSTTTYASLFSAVGHTWNGNVDPGGGQFRLPNFAGRTPVGAGAGSGLTARTAGQSGGAETVTLSVGNLASHNHTENAHDHGGATGIESANHIHNFAVTTGAADISHHHQDGQHVHWALGGLAKYLTEIDSSPSHGSGSLTLGSGLQNYSWDVTTGGNLAVTYTSDAGGSHAHSVTGNTSGMSVDHLHGINPATPTVNNTGSGTPFGVMPPFGVAPMIIRAL